MQELIERLDKEINPKYPDGYNIVMKIAKNLTEQMLEKEKEVMCEFGLLCTSNGSLHEIGYVFNETFKTKE